MNEATEWIVAVTAIATLFVFYSATLIGAVVWITNKLSEMKAAIIEDFDSKHAENNKRIEALNTLVIRHDVQLNPEFYPKNGHPRHEQ